MRWGSQTNQSGLTPIRSRRLKTESLDADTIKEKKEMDDARFVIESDDELNSEDEEVIEMEKELKKLRAARKQRKSYERKEKLRQLEEKKKKKS